MGRTRRRLFCLGYVFTVLSAFGQEKIPSQYPDTLRVKTDGQNLITFAFCNIQNDQIDLDDELWKSILGIMESSLQTATNSEGVRVSYEKVKVNDEEQARIEVAKIEIESDIFWIDSEGMRHDQSDRIEFEITLPEIAILFFLNDLDDLEEIKEVSIQSIWEGKKDKVDVGRVLYNGTGSYELGVLRISEINHSDRKDFLEMRAGMGIGFYRDRFVPSLSYDVSFNFSDRYGQPRTKFGVLYTQHYFHSEKQEGDFDLGLNHFLSVYWAMSRGTMKEYGLGFGYLVAQNGSFYKGNTYKVTIYNRNTSRTSLTPELIFTNNFEQAFPALRFGLSF